MNAKQAKFVEYFLLGNNQTDAYMLAYGSKNKDYARKAGSRLMTNGDIRQAIDEALDSGVWLAGSILRREAPSAAETVCELKDMGNSQYNVRLQAAKDILDRVGLKPKDEVDHSGDVGFRVILPPGMKKDEL